MTVKAGLGAVGLACAVAACSLLEKPATELVITVDTTFGVPCTIDALRVEVISAGEVITEELALSDADLPGSIVVVPESDPGQVSVTVTGLLGGEAFASATGLVDLADKLRLEQRFVLDQSCVPGPCPAIGVGGYVGLPPPQPRHGCGTRGYRISPTFLTMRDACDMQQVVMARILPGADEQELPSPLTPALPFPFTFYGEPVSQFWVGTNGYLAFSATAPNQLISTIGAADTLSERFLVPAILPFWDNLRTSPKGVCLAVTGEAPDRMFWITWKEACVASGALACGGVDQGPLTFTVALEEGSHSLYVGYQTMSGAGDRSRGLTATIGVTSGSPACPASECSSEGVCEGGAQCGYTEVSAQGIVNPLSTFRVAPR